MACFTSTIPWSSSLTPSPGFLTPGISSSTDGTRRHNWFARAAEKRLRHIRISVRTAVRGWQRLRLRRGIGGGGQSHRNSTFFQDGLEIRMGLAIGNHGLDELL